LLPVLLASDLNAMPFAGSTPRDRARADIVDFLAVIADLIRNLFLNGGDSGSEAVVVFAMALQFGYYALSKHSNGRIARRTFYFSVV
jgi:hypothetical protein